MNCKFLERAIKKLHLNFYLFVPEGGIKILNNDFLKGLVYISALSFLRWSVRLGWLVAFGLVYALRGFKCMGNIFSAKIHISL